MRNIRKAFTLVELSIVIVIIGIIISFTVKGKKLVEAAEWKSDLSSIRQVHMGLAFYVEDNDFNFESIPIHPSQTIHVNYDKLIEEGYLEAKWLLLQTFKHAEIVDFNSNNVGAMPLTILYGCTGGPSGPFKKKSRVGNLCSEIRNGADGNLKERISSYQVCLLESSLDDNNTDTGSGRTSAVGVPSVKSYISCDENSRSYVDSYGWVYVYEF